MSSLAGNLVTMPLPDVLQWIGTGRKTGTLHLMRRAVEKRLLFREGRLISSWSNHPRDRLGQFLIRDRRLTEQQLFEALLRQEREGRLLGVILIEDGVLTATELRGLLQVKAEESIYDAFLWAEGQFDFLENDLPDEIAVHVDLNVTELVLEGIRRVDDWTRIRRTLPHARVRFHVSDPQKRTTSVIEDQALDLAASGMSLAEIALETRRSEYETAVILFRLHERNLLDVIGGGSPSTEADMVGVIDGLLKRAQDRIDQRDHAAAAKEFEEILRLDPINQHAKKGLLALAEEHDREPPRGVNLDGVPVLARALADLTQESLDPREGFVLSRINGEWSVRSILGICPIPENDVLSILSRLLSRGLIAMR
ncbi:MAG: DUF4388 domain-containing protein [Vicinamibacteria bacterium]|nr:DUF4388 domain-containing protein [Vicinamibacteria bacterium]